MRPYPTPMPTPTPTTRRASVATALLALALAAPTDAAAQTRAATTSDSADAASTVAHFHRALAAGDSVAVLALLDPAARILESGGVETVADYRAHHLASDVAYARAVPAKRGPVRVTVRGDVAWATSTSESVGEFRGRAVSSVGAELMVLTRMPHGWRISAIHWSSRRRGG
jgi:hypothetical protein